MRVLTVAVAFGVVLTLIVSACGNETNRSFSVTASPEGPHLCLPLNDGNQRGIEGQIVDGPFDFRLTLLEDPVFQPPAEAWHPYAMTSIRNVGWSYECTYDGPDVGETVIHGALFVNGELLQDDMGDNYNDTLRNGAACGNRSSGIPPTVEPKDGDKIGLGAWTASGNSTYGALMTFTAVANNSGLEACDPTFAAWPPTPSPGTASH